MTNEQKREGILKFRTDLENAVKRFKELKLTTAVTTTDGDALSIDADSVVLGASVYTLDDNGNNTPAEDGEYTLDNGMVITITDGKISNIAGDPNTPQEETTTPDSEMKEEMADTATSPTDATAPSDTDTADATEDADLADRVAQLEQQMSEVVQALQQVMEVVSQSQSMNEQLMSKVEAISKEPASPAIKNKPVGLNANKTTNADIESFRRRKQLMIEKGII